MGRLVIIRAGTVVTGETVHSPGWLAVDGERVTAVGSGTPPEGPVDADLGDDAVLVPGFVDVHVHGGGGHGFEQGTRAAVTGAVAYHRRFGTTTTLASIVTLGPDRLLDVLGPLAELTADGVVAGVHLEGPWLSPQRSGAHDVALLRDPDVAEVAGALAAGRGTVRMVTLAPERPGGLDAIRAVVEAGAVAAVGHTDADLETTRRAVDAGARVATHLFNAMPPMHHRAPGPIVALLDDERVTLELIADGVHLDPGMVGHVFGVAGAGRIALVTDAMAATGMPDGDYRLGDLPVTVAGGVARLAAGPIAGSTVTMDALFRTAAAVTGSLLAAAVSTSVTPARALGLTDVGLLAPGRFADAVVLDDALAVRAVLRRGAWLSGR